jgi:hypothetical protein
MRGFKSSKSGLLTDLNGVQSGQVSPCVLMWRTMITNFYCRAPNKQSVRFLSFDCLQEFVYQYSILNIKTRLYEPPNNNIDRSAQIGQFLRAVVFCFEQADFFPEKYSQIAY